MGTAVYKRLLKFDAQINAGDAPMRIAGVDEVGRGPLAGPVVAAAVILYRPGNFKGLNDSKQVEPELRETLFFEILRCSVFGLGVVDEATIDKINIYQASRLAMKRAVLSLPCTPDLLLIDGKARLDLPLEQKTLIGGDAKSASIAAASIVAKVYRDRWMHYLHDLYPDYDFKSHKGYATPVHLERIRAAGPSPVHRMSFSPFRPPEMPKVAEEPEELPF